MGYQTPGWLEALDQASDFAAEEAHVADQTVVSVNSGACQHTVGLPHLASCSWPGRQGDLPAHPVDTLGDSHLSFVDPGRDSLAAQGSFVEWFVVGSWQGTGLGIPHDNLDARLDLGHHVVHNSLGALAGQDAGTFVAASAAVAARPCCQGSLAGQDILAGQADLDSQGILADPGQVHGCWEDNQEVLQDHLHRSLVDTALVDHHGHRTGTGRHNLVASSVVLGGPASAVGGLPVAAAPGPPTPAFPSGRGLQSSGTLRCRFVQGPRSRSYRDHPGHPAPPGHLQKDLRKRLSATYTRNMMTDTCEIFHISRAGKCYLKTIFSALALRPCNDCKECVHVVTSTLPSLLQSEKKRICQRKSEIFG